MAGNYPDVPGHRFALDKDGSVYAHYRTVTGLVTQLTSGQAQNLNDESPATFYNLGNFGNGWMGVFFPELRDIAGVYYRWTGVPGGVLEWSGNSTNGLDGTWTATGVSFGSAGAADVPAYRTAIQAVSLVNVKALRFTIANATSQDYTCTSFHVYGAIAAGQNPNRLAIWHPTLDQPITGHYLDWGDTPRSSSADRTFRVKNLSSTLTANGITVGYDALTNTTPSVPGQHTLSDDGTTFTATESIASLAPGAISSVLTARRITPSNATLGLWALRVNAEASSWA